MARRLSDLWPNSADVKTLGLGAGSDGDIWWLAARDSFVIVTKDKDFYGRAVTFGPPPQVVWLDIGNQTISKIEAILRQNAGAIMGLDVAPERALLVIRL